MSAWLRILPLMAVIAFAGAASAGAQERREIPEYRTYGEAASPAHRDEVAALLDAYREAWAAQDAEALMAIHAPDAEWINAYARIFQHTQPPRAPPQPRLFPAFPPALSRQDVATTPLISIRYVGDDAVIAHYFTDGNRGASRNDGEAMRRTHFHFVMERRAEGWRIVHTVIMEAR